MVFEAKKQRIMVAISLKLLYLKVKKILPQKSSEVFGIAVHEIEVKIQIRMVTTQLKLPLQLSMKRKFRKFCITP